MRVNLIAYAITAFLFFGMDFVWLSSTYNALYKPRMANLLLDKPNLPVAAGFYLIYVIGILIFAVLPALEQGSWTRALWAGALLGFVAYGTYDMTNLATLANWSSTLSAVDMLWGTVATGTAATAGYFITRSLV